jgi:hypothetical protein
VVEQKRDLLLRSLDDPGQVRGGYDLVLGVQTVKSFVTVTVQLTSGAYPS